MTKMLKMVGVAVGVMGLVSSDAATIQYSDLDVYPGAGILLDGANPSFTGNLGITTDDADGITDQTGYSPGSGLLAALAGFTFTTADGNFLPHELTFQLQGDPFATPYSSGTALTWAINDLVVGNALLTLAGDGDMDFTITYVSGPAF